MLGLIIGISSVILVTALGVGAQRFVKEQFQDIGTNVVPSLMMDRAQGRQPLPLWMQRPYVQERLRFKMLLLLPMEMVKSSGGRNLRFRLMVHLLWQKSSKSTMTKAAISLLLKFQRRSGDSGTKPQ